MLESLINPRSVEHGSWKMFFIGLLYASVSLLIVHLFFSRDPALSKASGMMVVTFCIMFSLPFMYYLIKKEEVEDETVEGFFRVWKIHQDAIYAFMWLFLGFVVAFSFWHIALGNPNLLNFQIETYCRINSPGNIDLCVEQYTSGKFLQSTGSAVSGQRFLSILENNVYVMIFTLLFSLVFGAGAIFVLAWNASVIAAAVSIITKYRWEQIPIGIAQFMLHGIPEIAAYFVTALAGGIFGVGAIRNGIRNSRFLRVLGNVIILLFIALLLLLLAAIIEVYITPIFF